MMEERHWDYNNHTIYKADSDENPRSKRKTSIEKRMEIENYEGIRDLYNIHKFRKEATGVYKEGNQNRQADR